MVTKLLIVGFLIAHAAIHTSFLSPAPPATAGGPRWPFDIRRSWALRSLGVEGASVRGLGIALVAAVLGAYGAAVLAIVGVLPGELAPPAIAAGSAASLLLLGLFFNTWFVVGIAIDLVLLWLTLGNPSLDALRG